MLIHLALKSYVLRRWRIREISSDLGAPSPYSDKHLNQCLFQS
ncbi:hypothetical protein SynRS9902_01188 [Synechococcus sp. RS9902]|nr:hypothetical protein SynRS9902_01188 [Synechococcus sp. RS9902]